MKNIILFLLLVIYNGVVLAKIFCKCELAEILEKKHGMSREEVKNWVCIAEHESTFNTEAINSIKNHDGSWDYGLFQLNSKYWCEDHYGGKNVCRMKCTSLLDQDLTDDLACIRRIVKDTERWKGKGTGLTAWVAYVNRCQNNNLDKYMSECWYSAPNVNKCGIRIEKDTTTSSTTPSTTTSTTTSSTTTVKELSSTTEQTSTTSLTTEKIQDLSNTESSSSSPDSKNQRFPLARVPLPSPQFHSAKLPSDSQRAVSANIPKSRNAENLFPVGIVNQSGGKRKLNVVTQGSSPGLSLTVYT